MWFLYTLAHGSGFRSLVFHYDVSAAHDHIVSVKRGECINDDKACLGLTLFFKCTNESEEFLHA